MCISIDDFGTGYSSLSYLRFSIDDLKIDKSFLMNMNKDKRNEVIVHAMIDPAHNLNMKVVTEGVCEKAIYEKLKQIKCGMAQGDYIAKPMPSDEFPEWLEKSD